MESTGNRKTCAPPHPPPPPSSPRRRGPSFLSVSETLTMTQPPKKSWHDDLPFPKHWLGYIALKVIVLALAVYAVLRWKGLI